MGLKWILSAGLLCLNAAAAGLPESAKSARDAHQAILTEGWHISPAEAAQLESQLASRPHDVAARTRLISYYYQQMIENPSYSLAAREPSGGRGLSVGPETSE